MAEKKVLTDRNLLNIILKYAGINILNRCEVCGKVVKYQILHQEVNISRKCYINLESCEKLYFCSDLCYIVYKGECENLKFCIKLFLILIIAFLVLCLFILIIASWKGRSWRI